MEQRKWLSWNDLQHVLQHVLKTYSERAGGPRTCRVSCTTQGTELATEPNHRLNQPSTQKTPVGTKSYRASYLGTDTVTRWLLEWLACRLRHQNSD